MATPVLSAWMPVIKPQPKPFGKPGTVRHG